MAKEVIKKGGKREPFKAEKIKRSIKAACKGAHLSVKRAKVVAGKVSWQVLKFCSKRKAVGTATLRKQVLSQLDKVEPAAAKAWRKYDQRRRSRRSRR